MKDVTILSSGIEADRDLNGPIVPFVKRALEEQNLLQFTGNTWTQTSQPMIDVADIVVFMNDDVFEDALEKFDVPMARSEIWQIPDTQGVDGQIKQAVESLMSRSAG